MAGKAAQEWWVTGSPNAAGASSPAGLGARTAAIAQSPVVHVQQDVGRASQGARYDRSDGVPDRREGLQDSSVQFFQARLVTDVRDYRPLTSLIAQSGLQFLTLGLVTWD